MLAIQSLHAGEVVSRDTVLALYRCGRQADALDVCRQSSERFRGELQGRDMPREEALNDAHREIARS